MKFIFVINLAATLLLTGLVWTVQLMSNVILTFSSYDDFSNYPIIYMTNYPVIYIILFLILTLPLMGIEGITAIGLAFSPPEKLSRFVVWIGLALVAIGWLITFYLYIPRQGVLIDGFYQEAFEALVSAGWWRTLAWTARSVLVLWMTVKVIGWSASSPKPSI
jgi:hypothetical protein